MKKIIYLFSLIFLFACAQSKDEVKIPDDIIPPQEMINVIIDFHIAEAALVECQNKKEDVNVTTILYYNSILKKHKITRAKFDKSMKFYTENIQLLQIIYEEVGNELSTMQSKERL
jgi:hypothetical protein